MTSVSGCPDELVGHLTTKCAISPHVRAQTVILCLAAAACATTDSPDDTPDEASPGESFLVDGRAAGTIAEGSDQARAVLRAANRATPDELTSKSEIGLASKAAANVIAYRNGPDGKPHTADDRTIATLAELDGIPWVGRSTFDRLLAWGTKQGFAEPRSCDAGGARGISSSVVVTPDDGDARLLAIIDGAAATIDIVVYELSRDDVYSALGAAVQRGVRVRVIVDGQLTQNPAVVTRLTGLGVQAKLSSPQFTYTHQKTLVADGRVAFIFTGNFDVSSFDKGRNYAAVDTAWQDLDDLEALFEGDWSGVAPDLTCTRLVVSPVNSRGRILDVIGGARTHLDVEALYVTDPDVLQALIDAHKRGIAVRVLINDPSFGFGTDAAGKQLVAAGVEARRSGALFVHAKVLLADGAAVYFGSENFSKNSLLYNREVGAVFADTEIDVARIAAAFASDWGRGISF